MTEPLIGLATGIVMARRDCNPDEAFTLLTEAAQDYHMSVTELAECVLADLKLSSSRTHPPAEDDAYPASALDLMPATVGVAVRSGRGSARSGTAVRRFSTTA